MKNNLNFTTKLSDDFLVSSYRRPTLS